MNKNRIPGLDSIRCFACLGILAMHFFKNAHYNLDPIWAKIISSLSWLVYIFIILSSLGLCIGYFKRINEKTFNLEVFYSKRFLKIAPFFILLIIINLLLDFSINNLYEGVVESTMLFGYLPNSNLNVIGVGWTIGLLFLFYIFFPFFTVLIKNRRRTWICFILSLIIHFICDNYFFSSNFVGSTFIKNYNFLYMLPLFFIGALIYHYMPIIQKNKKMIKVFAPISTAIFALTYYLIPMSDDIISFLLRALISTGLIISFIPIPCRNVLVNKATLYVGSISFEIYLAHMIIFRVLEKTSLLHIFENDLLSFVSATLISIVLLAIIIRIYQFIFFKIKTSINPNNNRTS